MATDHVSRFIGIALGKEKNFQAKTDGLITSGDGTPTVAIRSLLYTNNTSDTVITDFDDGAEGQIIHLFMIDNSTRLANTAPLYLTSSDNLLGANNSITLFQRGTGWYEIARSRCGKSDILIVVSGNGVASSAIDVNGLNTIISIATGGAPITIGRLTNGQEGQKITILSTNSATVITNSAGSILLSCSGNLILSNSASTTLVRHGGDRWREIARHTGKPNMLYVSSGLNITDDIIDVSGGIDTIVLDILVGTNSGPIVVDSLRHGVPGQKVTFINLQSSAILTQSGGVTCMTFSTSGGNYVMAASAATTVMNVGNHWYGIGQNG